MTQKQHFESGIRRRRGTEGPVVYSCEVRIQQYVVGGEDSRDSAAEGHDDGTETKVQGAT